MIDLVGSVIVCLVLLIVAIVATYNLLKDTNYLPTWNNNNPNNNNNNNNYHPNPESNNNYHINKNSMNKNPNFSNSIPPRIEPHIPHHMPVPPMPPVPILEDPVKIYDLNNINNPLVYPTSRPPSYAFRPMMNNPLFFYPTRGFPDQPGYIANLIETKLASKDWEDKNKKFDRIFNHSEDSKEWDKEDRKEYNPQLPSVLQLMGQQKYPGSSRYDYYVLLPSTGTNPSIKYVIHTPKHEEVYDGDMVEVLGKTYTVRKNKSPFEYFAP